MDNDLNPNASVGTADLLRRVQRALMDIGELERAVGNAGFADPLRGELRQGLNAAVQALQRVRDRLGAR